MSDLQGRHILLGVCGSVAAFKSAALASELTKAGVEVRVILTASGERFVTADTFRDLTNQSVARSMWDVDMDHIDLARWADLVIVAPATANMIARAALGLADDLLSTVLLVVSAPILIVPAMESRMWENVATSRNVAALRERGVTFVGPDEGRLASGALGIGRMAEQTEIVAAAQRLLDGMSQPDKTLRGLRIVVTAGPTQEAIDPVRFISNRSSGKMGYEVAAAASRHGASVRLISGPVEADLRRGLGSGVEVIDVTTAGEMRDAVLAATDAADVIVMSAAVADFRPVGPRDQKIKKGEGLIHIDVESTDDILTLLADSAPEVVRIGFAAETSDLLAQAGEKLRRKRLAMIVANDVSGTGGEVFGADSNQVTILRPGFEPELLPRMPKRNVAERIVELIPELLRANMMLPT